MSLIFSNLTGYLVPAHIQKKRFQILQNCAKRHGFTIVSDLNENTLRCKVTHILSEMETVEDVLKHLKLKRKDLPSTKFVSFKWLHDSIRAKIALDVESYTLHEEKEKVVKNTDAFDIEVFNSKTLERRAPLQHKNKHLTDPLGELSNYWELLGTTETDQSRSIAFARASAALKCLPFRVRDSEQVKQIKDIGSHSLKIIEEIIRTGSCQELVEKTCSERYIVIKGLTEIFGVGAVTARRWYDEFAISCADDAVEKLPSLPFRDARVKLGLLFAEDLCTPVMRDLAQRIHSFVQNLTSSLLPGVIVELAGGFRRGKEVGHDVDLLITHPDEGTEQGLLTLLHQELCRRGYLLWGHIEDASVAKVPSKLSLNQSAMDNFVRCLGIFRFPREGTTMRTLESHFSIDMDLKNGRELLREPRDWVAVRMDLILIPYSQWAYGLLGWTGSRQFERSLRHYATRDKKMILTSHGLWDKTQSKNLAASTEEEIFEHLGLTYRPPELRNF